MKTPCLKPTILFLFLFFTVHAAFAQKGNVKGKLIDSKTKKAIDYASFAFKNVKDSTVAAMGATTTEGVFSAKALNFGQYKLYLALIGYKPIIKAFELTKEKPAVDFGDLEMEESSITLNDILVKSELLPMIIKKDTIEFAADAFKTQADANVEDVLKVMPGMEVDKDGNISFNGKKIDKVLVGGKDFFGNDPKTATQNLPKDIVKKIQVIEKKTDEAIFKGIDDGKRENVLNIELKDDKKKGYFGNAVAGKANGSLYDASLSLNRFNDKRQISIISLANNINKTSFSFNDLSDFLGGDVFGSGLVNMVAIDGVGNISVGFGGEGTGGGINDNKGIGLNFNDEWGKNKKLPNKISFNYMFNTNYGVQQSLSSRLNLLGQDSYFNDRSSDATTSSDRHRLNMKLDIPIDSTAKLQITPNFGFSSSNSENKAIFSSYVQTNRQNINKGNSLNSNDNKTPGFGGRIFFNKKLKKKGRGYSLSANGNFSNSTLNGLNLSNITINDNGVPTSTILDQLIDQSGDVNSYGFNFDYAEPIAKKMILSASYGYLKREDVIDRMVYDFNTGTTRYDLINAELSRSLQNFNESHGIGLNYNYMPNDKLNLTINTTQRYVELTGNNLMNHKNVNTNFVLFQPNFYFSYKMSKTASLSVNGSRYMSTPSISQLQPLTDNSNPLQIITGNPLLKPSADNNFSLSFNKFNPGSGSSINFNLGYSTVDNRIANNSLFDPKTGIQTTFYDNIDGNSNFNARVGGSFKIKSLGLTFTPYVSVATAKNKSFLNREKVTSSSVSYNLSDAINYVIGSDLQFSNRINANIREVSYDYNNLPNANFTSIFNNLSLNVSLPYELRFTLSSNVAYNANVGIGANNNTIHTANVSFEKMFLKKALSLKATVSDVFNNSRNSSRFATDAFILDSVTLGMRRYVLFALSYRLKKFGGAASGGIGAPPPMIRF